MSTLRALEKLTIVKHRYDSRRVCELCCRFFPSLHTTTGFHLCPGRCLLLEPSQHGD